MCSMNLICFEPQKRSIAPATNCASTPNFTLIGTVIMTAEQWGFGIGALTALALSACAAHSSIPNPFAEWNGHLHLESHPNYSKSVLQRDGQPVVLLVGEVSDGRADAPSPKVGVIGSTVMFMASPRRPPGRGPNIFFSLC